MKRIKVQTASKILLSLLMVVASFSAMFSTQLVNAEGEISIAEIITYSEDKTSATILLDAKSVGEGYQIIDIKNPDDSPVDLIKNQGYVVKENGKYKFEITYREKKGELSEPTTYIKEVEVTDIKITEKEVVSSEMKPTPTLRSNVTSGGATIDMPDYDPLVGFNNSSILNVNVKVDFGEDVATTNKKLTFHLPEGLKFIQIPVAGTYNSTNVDTGIIASLPAGDPLAVAIQSVSLPQKDKLANTFGDVVYTFDKGVKSATITFKVRVDNLRFYKAMTLNDAMSAKVTKGAADELIGNVSQSIDVYGYVIGNGNLSIYSNEWTTSQLLASTATEPSKGSTPAMRLVLSMNGSPLDVPNRVVKNMKAYIYYPEGMEYVSFNNPYGGTIVHEPGNSRIVVTNPSFVSSGVYRVLFSVPEGTAAGVYAAPAKDEIEYEYYDGVKETKVSTSALFQVTIVDSVENKMSVSSFGEGYIDTSVEDHYSYGPFFNVNNAKTAGKKTNQVYHVEIGADYHVSKLNIPFDRSLVGTGNVMGDIEYKTTKDSSWRTAPSSVTTEGSSIMRVLSADKVGLDADEFFSEVRVNVGSFAVGYVSGSAQAPKAWGNTTTYGRLVNGAANENVTISLYDADDESVKATSTGKIYESRNLAKTTTTQSYGWFRDMDDKGISQIVAGQAFNIKAEIAIHDYQYGTVSAVQAPEIYIRQPLGTTIAIDDIEIVDNKGKIYTDWFYTTSINSFGETIYMIKTSNETNIGNFFDSAKKEVKKLFVNYDVSTSVKMVGNYDLRELIGWGKSDLKPVASTGGATHPVIDTYDFNGNNDRNELILTTSTKMISVIENKNVLMETFISLAGEEPKDPYVNGNDDTVAFFTPGTEADYTIKITNNGDVPANAVTSYIPIPKTGKSFGVSFQAEAFKWDMTLISAISSYVGFDVLYSTDATEANFADGATYTTTPPAKLSDVKMVKIVSTVAIAPGDGAEFKIPLKVNETFDSASEGEKIATRNVYNPVYEVKSSTFNGILPATKVGTELTMAEIGGTVFIDKDSDGQYKPVSEGGVDTPIENHEVELYKWNGTSYVPVLDGTSNQVKVKTNADGVYLFDYTVGMGYDKYAIRFVEITGTEYQYTLHNTSNRLIDSDAIIANDLPNVGDTYRGWVLDIDATKPVAKTIGAGFLRYNPPIDLEVEVKTTPNTVKVGQTITVGHIIKPVFWENIKDATTPYTWEFVNAADAGKAVLTTNADGTVTIAPNALAGGQTTFELTLSIKDIYGTIKTSDAVTITVISNVKPTIVAPELDLYVGETMDLTTGVSAKDNTNTTIAIVWAGATKNASMTHSIPNESGVYTVPGTYEVTYQVTDSDNNTGTQTRIVKVNAEPALSASSQVYTLNDTTIMASILANPVATWKKASATVGAEPTVVSILGPASSGAGLNKIEYTLKSGPSTDFSKIGAYEVEYKAANPAGKTAIKTIKVLIKGTGTVEQDGLMIDANGFVLEYADLATLSQAIVKDATHGNVSAFKMTMIGSEITNVENTTSKVTLNETEYDAIKSSSVRGGVFNLTFVYKDGTKQVTKIVQVLVKPKVSVVSPDGTVVIDANGFELSNVDARSLNNEKALLSAKVTAVEINTNANGYITIGNLAAVVNVVELADINAADKVGGIFPLSFSATGATDVAEKTVQVLVKPAGAITEPSQTLIIGGEGFTLENADAATLNVADSLLKSKATAYKKIIHANGVDIDFVDITNTIQVDSEDITSINAATSAGGIYPLNYFVKDDGITLTKRVMVHVKGETTPPVVVTPDGDELAISGNSVTMKYKEAVNATEASVLTLTGAKAFLIKSGKEVVVYIDATDIQAIRNVSKDGGTVEVAVRANSGNLKTRSTVSNEVKVKVVILKDTEVSAPSKKPSTGVNTGDTSNMVGMLFLLLVAGGYMVYKTKKA